MKSAIRSILADLGSGLSWAGARAADAWRIAAPIATMGVLAVLRPVGRAIGKAAGPVFLSGTSLLLVLTATALVINIDFAAKTLPQEQVNLASFNRPPSVTVIDRDGEVIGVRGSRYGEPVTLETLPPFVIDAFLATEDRRFFEHHGVDIRGLIRAAIKNWRAGRVVEGGSTITQQLAKNVFLEHDRTVMRKLREFQLALWLEARYTKEEILSLYLNRIYLGGGNYGISAAAEAYFSKPATELTLGEAALIAGLPKAPSTLAPTTNLDGALLRSYQVIDNLIDAGLVNEVSGSMAKLAPPDLAVKRRRDGDGHFLDHVMRELDARFGSVTEDLVVETTLDRRAQDAAIEAVRSVITIEAQEKGAEEAAVIAYDEDGGIVAMVGGRSYVDSQFNRATQARRQTGSAFKPFVFLAAIEAGLSPETIVVDQPVSVGDWQPSNYNPEHRGPMRLATALARSINTVSVQVTESIGRDRVIDAARRAGITADLSPHASLALGTAEMTLEELTRAYLTFAHHGAAVKGHAIETVRTREGRELYRYAEIENFAVIEPALAEDTTRMLMQVMRTGTGARAAVAGHETAGKTGTTNDWKDAWFIGFSSRYTAGVWVGNDPARPMDRLSGSTLPLDIWHRFMVAVHEGETPRPLLRDQVAVMEDVSRLGGFYGSLIADLSVIAPGARNWRPSPLGPIAGVPPQPEAPVAPAREVEGRSGIGRVFPFIGRGRRGAEGGPVSGRAAPGTADPDGE